jgi:ATP-dependent DNA helicase RecG
MSDLDFASIVAQGESRTVEFKSDRGPLDDQALVEAVVCLANGSGGTLIIGVEDDGTVTGLHPKHQKRSELLPSFVASRTMPHLNVEMTIIELRASSGPLPVAVLRIPASPQPVATSDGRMIVRYIGTHGQPGCRPLYPNELSGWYADRGKVDVSAQVVPGASWDDLDPLEFVRLRRMVETYRGDAALLDLDDHALARALGFVVSTDNGPVPTIAGLLLVGREAALTRHLPAHEVAFQVLRGTDVAVNDFYRWPLLRSVERILEAFSVRNEERELNVGLFRVGIPAYAPRAFREALNNALVHRDYHRLGAVHVQLHEDRVIVRNPGGFLEGVRPDNLLRIGPHPRNPSLADCFKRIGLVERTGRGVNIIYEGQLRNGRRPPSYGGSTDVSVSVTLYGGPADLDFVELMLTHESERGRALTVSELLILDHVYREREIETTVAADITQLPESDARSVLEGFVEAGILEKRGTRRDRTYHLSASIYREMGEPAAYVRARGFDRLQMEQMIVQYIEAHGQITRREVMGLCRVSANQASYLLRKLVTDRSLRLVGMGRTAHYVLEERED